MPRVKTSVLGKLARLSQILARTTTSLLKVKALKAKPEAYKNAYAIAKQWSADALKLVGVSRIKVSGAPICDQPCLFLGNHMSYLDILVIYSQVSVVFVAKKEVLDWPLFGAGAQAMGTIFIDRRSMKSRKGVATHIAKGISRDKKSIVVFPEGTSSIEGKPWKRGAVAMAKEHNILVQAFRVSYHPARDAAFIGDDDLTSHLWNLMGSEHIEASIEFFPPFHVQDVDADTSKMEAWVQNSVAQELKQDVSY